MPLVIACHLFSLVPQGEAEDPLSSRVEGAHSWGWTSQLSIAVTMYVRMRRRTDLLGLMLSRVSPCVGSVAYQGSR